MARTAWLNGVFIAEEEAKVSPFDRGFLFADAVYEVTAVYGGRLVDIERHLDRLARSLRELDFPIQPERAELEAAHRRLVELNGLIEGVIYLQVTRGGYGRRDFLPPADEATRLTCFAFTEARPLIDTSAARDGVAVISAPDIRWARCDIKTTQLLAACLAKHGARKAGAADAWFVGEDGLVTEGASSNAWIVTPEGELTTRSLSPDILAGVTRHTLFDAAAAAGLSIVERSFTLEEAMAAREAFTSGASAPVNPVVRIDGQTVGDGRPGPVTRRLQRLYAAAAGATQIPNWMGDA